MQQTIFKPVSIALMMEKLLEPGKFNAALSAWLAVKNPRLGDLARVALRDTTEHVDYRLLAD